MQNTKYQRISSESSDESDDEHVPSIMEYWGTIRPSSTDKDSESEDDFPKGACFTFEKPKNDEIIDVEDKNVANASFNDKSFALKDKNHDFSTDNNLIFLKRFLHLIHLLSSEPSDNFESTRLKLVLLSAGLGMMVTILLFTVSDMISGYEVMESLEASDYNLKNNWTIRVQIPNTNQ